MERLEDRVEPVIRTGSETGNVLREEASQKQAGAGEERTAEKPQVAEKIVIEEISIDGMCGVY